MTSSAVRPVALAAALLAVAVALAVGVFLGIASHGNDSADTVTASAAEATSVDVGFARDMRDHHAQAVEMSVLVRDATSDPEVRTLALDILLTQQQQQGQMYGWLVAWQQDQVGSEPRMSWMSEEAQASAHAAAMAGAGKGMQGMDHSTGGSAMPGMATAEELAQLEQAKGRRAERLYLQLMIPHHQAGVAMAEYAVERATQPQVQRLAESIVAAQTSELDVLRSMLAARGGRLRAS